MRKKRRYLTDFLQIISSSFLLPVEYPGEVLPHMSYVGMCGPRVWFLSDFGQKRGIDFDHFGLNYLYRVCFSLWIGIGYFIFP